MNPLGQLPAATSQQFQLDKLDWTKIARFLLVQLGGLFLTYVPVLAGFRYVVRGQDITPLVVLGVNTVAEAIRRFLAGQPRN